MKSYHFYVLDASNRVCQPPRIMRCLDDQSAIEAASRLPRLLAGGAVEVWEYDRFVARLAPGTDEETNKQRPLAAVLMN